MLVKALKHMFHFHWNWDSPILENGRVSDHQELYVKDRVRSGSYGDVYKGEYHMYRNDKDEKVIPVAVKRTKVKPSQLSYELDTLMELKSEPEIIHLYNYRKSGKEEIFVTEFCAGGDLHDFISKQGWVSELMVRHVIKWLFLAIQKCHTHGIIHADIKLENIGVLHRHDLTELKLLDFGTSKRLGLVYIAEELKGSPRYFAPELVSSLEFREDKYLKAIDVWCAGVVSFILMEHVYPNNGAVPKCGSEEYKSFIKDVLTDRENRLTVEQCLNHQWLYDF